jgi:hypothetical protein
MSDVEARIGRLSPGKRALLERQLLLRAETPSEGLIPRRHGSGPCPLSFPQRRLWFLEQLAPGQPTYNAALAMRVRGGLDLGRLEQGVRTVISRHEALRTVFGVHGLEPVQLLLENWSFAVDRRDLRNVATADREEEMLRQAREEARRPFDLGADLMLRLTSLRLAEDEHVLVFIEHHIAFDGWSDGQLFRELAALYEDDEPELDMLPIQYADWSAWQHDRISGATLDRLTGFWGEVLRGAPPLLELPLDSPRPPVQTFAGSHHLLAPLPLAARVRALARDEGATPFMVLLAAFAAALHRWSGAHDLVIGSPVANRDHVQLEHLIGFFSNTFVLRVRLDRPLTLRELVRECRAVALDAYEHAELPFEKLVEHVRPPRDPRFNPIFQVNFRAQSRAPAVLALQGLDIEPLLLDLGFSRFDLALDCHLDGEHVMGYLEYNSALFAEGTVRALGVRMSRLLEDGLARPDVPLGELAWARAGGPGIRGARG